MHTLSNMIVAPEPIAFEAAARRDGAGGLEAAQLVKTGLAGYHYAVWAYLFKSYERRYRWHFLRCVM